MKHLVPCFGRVSPLIEESPTLILSNASWDNSGKPHNSDCFGSTCHVFGGGTLDSDMTEHPVIITNTAGSIAEVMDFKITVRLRKNIAFPVNIYPSQPATLMA
jgi:hypothetical protein